MEEALCMIKEKREAGEQAKEKEIKQEGKDRQSGIPLTFQRSPFLSYMAESKII